MWLRRLSLRTLIVVSLVALVTMSVVHTMVAKTAFLEAAGLPVALYDHAHENPTESDAATCADAARAAKFDCFVALGGGSSLGLSS